MRRADKEQCSRARYGAFPLGCGLERVPLGDAKARALRIAGAMRRLGLPGLHNQAIALHREYRESGEAFAVVAIGTRGPHARA